MKYTLYMQTYFWLILLLPFVNARPENSSKQWRSKLNQSLLRGFNFAELKLFFCKTRIPEVPDDSNSKVKATCPLPESQMSRKTFTHSQPALSWLGLAKTFTWNPRWFTASVFPNIIAWISCYESYLSSSSPKLHTDEAQVDPNQSKRETPEHCATILRISAYRISTLKDNTPDY